MACQSSVSRIDWSRRRTRRSIAFSRLFSPLINRCRAKSSRSAIAAFLLVVFVLVVVLPLVFIIVALTGSTIKFVSNLSTSTTARNAIHLLVPPIDAENSTVASTINGSTTNFIDFLTGDQNATYHLFERVLIQRDSISDFVQLFGGKALSVISTVAGATAQVLSRPQNALNFNRWFVRFSLVCHSWLSAYWYSSSRLTHSSWKTWSCGNGHFVTVLSLKSTWLDWEKLSSRRVVVFSSESV